MLHISLLSSTTCWRDMLGQASMWCDVKMSKAFSDGVIFVPAPYRGCAVLSPDLKFMLACLYVLYIFPLLLGFFWQWGKLLQHSDLWIVSWVAARKRLWPTPTISLVLFLGMTLWKLLENHQVVHGKLTWRSLYDTKAMSPLMFAFVRDRSILFALFVPSIPSRPDSLYNIHISEQLVSFPRSPLYERLHSCNLSVINFLRVIAFYVVQGPTKTIFVPYVLMSTLPVRSQLWF